MLVYTDKVCFRTSHRMLQKKKLTNKYKK